jgi:hypothetical protein
MNRPKFFDLLAKISSGRTVNPSKARKTHGGAISPTLKLAITLRWLAGASYLDLSIAYGVAPGTMYKSSEDGGPLWSTIEAIDELFEISFSYSEEDCMKQAQLFNKCGLVSGRMPGVVMALDVWICHTKKPTLSETTATRQYWNRKGTFGFPCLAACGADLRILWWSTKTTGNTHDSVSYTVCEDRAKIENLPEKFFAIGDNAFRNTNWLLTPFKGHSLTRAQSAFNWHLSSCRQVVERVFAVLIGRWLILSRKLGVQMRHWTLITRVCVKLHNYILVDDDHGPQFDINEWWAQYRPRNHHGENPPNPDLGGRLPPNDMRPIGDRRDTLTKLFETNGWFRPGSADAILRNT